MISFKHQGSFANTERFMRNNLNNSYDSIFKRYAEMGLDALTSATPVSSGETAGSWEYRIKKSKNKTTIEWSNSHMAGNVPVVILLHYGHATKSGSFIQGRDFINPSIRPVFDKISEELWKEVITK